MTALRVGLVCPYSFDSHGGVQNQVVGFARYLSRQGHEPYVLGPGELPPWGTHGLDHVSSAGTAIPVPYNGSVARVNFGPLSAARVRRWLRSSELDLLHVHEPITPSISLLALWAATVPVVATFHTATPRSRSMRLAGGALRTTVEKIGARIAVSESARQVVLRHLGRDAVVIPNGFSSADFTPRSAQHGVSPRGGAGGSSPPESTQRWRWRGGDRPRLTFLGRADEPRKGLSVLITALPAIRAHYPDLDVVVAGDRSASRITGCRALGPVDDQTKVELLAGTDVFVAPQLERESFGIVVLEAMASGAPVVASDLPAFAALLQPAGVTEPLGEIFACGDSRALAAAVVRTLATANQARTERARLAAGRYDWAHVGPAILDIYRQAIDRQAHSAPAFVPDGWPGWAPSKIFTSGSVTRVTLWR
jgi:phosphatidylinositol alpha-mannosyltransferase